MTGPSPSPGQRPAEDGGPERAVPEPTEPEPLPEAPVPEAPVPEAPAPDAPAPVPAPAAEAPAPEAEDDTIAAGTAGDGDGVAAAAGDGAADERAPAAAEGAPDGRRPRRRREPVAAALISVLTLLLGFAFAVQVRSTGNDQALAGSREEDLVRILDDLTGREDRLRVQISEQRAVLAQLNGGDSQSSEALKEARQRAETLGVLNGTLAAQGPGLQMTIGDPAGRITAAVLVKVIQELRAAGAETMQLDDVRVGASTAVTGTAGALQLDGRPVPAPYVFRVIGSPQDMATAMNIPNGVARTVRLRDGTIDVVQSDHVAVDALRVLGRPQYAEPTDGG
jgi:uncharacterized protein YlxW (UPF0749 family)